MRTLRSKQHKLIKLKVKTPRAVYLFFWVELFATDCSPVPRKIPNWASGEANFFSCCQGISIEHKKWKHKWKERKFKQSNCIVSSLFLQIERHAAHSSPVTLLLDGKPPVSASWFSRALSFLLLPVSFTCSHIFPFQNTSRALPSHVDLVLIYFCVALTGEQC